METSIGIPILLPEVLLISGILASLLKVGADLFASTKWKEYSFVSHSISILSASGAPTRPLVLALDLIYDLLMLAFSAGVWLAADQNSLLRIAAGLIAGNALISLFVSLFLPMRKNQEAGYSASAFHVVLMATGVFFFMLAMGLAGAAYRGWFRWCSFGILLAYFVLAAVRFKLPSPTKDGAPVPTVGIQERTMVLGYLLWVIALAVLLLSNPAG